MKQNSLRNRWLRRYWIFCYLFAGGVQQGGRQVFLRRLREHGKVSHWNDLRKANRNNVWN